LLNNVPTSINEVAGVYESLGYTKSLTVVGNNMISTISIKVFPFKSPTVVPAFIPPTVTGAVTLSDNSVL
jgi:hypothetical protein